MYNFKIFEIFLSFSKSSPQLKLFISLNEIVMLMKKIEKLPRIA